MPTANLRCMPLMHIHPISEVQFAIQALEPPSRPPAPHTPLPHECLHKQQCQHSIFPRLGVKQTDIIPWYAALI